MKENKLRSHHPIPTGAGKHTMIAKVQSRRKTFIAGMVLLGFVICAFTRSTNSPTSNAHVGIQLLGFLALVVCILGRTWTSLYISGRKNEQLVTEGPYSVVRNPLYFFSIIGAFGAGAQFGSMVCGLFFGLIVWGICYIVVLQEENFLFERHGLTFANYAANVPRLIPRLSLWRDLPSLTVMPRLVFRTFADATLFLLAIPAAETLEFLQDSGVLKILWHLP